MGLKAGPIGLQPNEVVFIDGKQDLSATIRANDGGCVYGITLLAGVPNPLPSTTPDLYDPYILLVDAQGLEGVRLGQHLP